MQSDIQSAPTDSPLAQAAVSTTAATSIIVPNASHPNVPNAKTIGACVQHNVTVAARSLLKKLLDHYH